MIHLGLRPLGRAAVLAACVFSLSACLKVEDDNSKVANELHEQNVLLAEQNELLSQQNEGAKIALFGELIDYRSEQAIENFTVQVKAGLDWDEPIAFSGGEFTLDNIPPASDIALLFSSPEGAFLDRVYFLGSRATGNSESYQDLGVISVSPGVDRTFSITRIDNSEPVPDLEFYAYSQLGSSDYIKYYAHRSQYSSETTEYTLTLPDGLVQWVYLDLDTDDDGSAEYYVEGMSYYGDTVANFRVDELSSATHFRVVPLGEDTTVALTINLTILDELGNAISDATPMYFEDSAAIADAEYNAETGQYEFSVDIVDSGQIIIPAFYNSEDVYLGSASLSINTTIEPGRYYIYADANTYSSYETYSDNGVINLVAVMREVTPTSDLELVLKTATPSGGAFGARFFYSSAVTLLPNSVNLYRENALTVVRGNDSSSDTVLPGVTLVSTEDLPIAATGNLSLGSTLLTVRPNNVLSGGHDYRIEVEDIHDNFAELNVDLYNDFFEFTVKSPEIFNINQLVLDNDNYWNNGSRIVSQTTAGVSSTRTDRSGGVYAFFPLSINNLENFSLSRRIVTNNGTAENSFATYEIVRDGNVRISRAYTVSLAYEEQVQTQSYYYSLFEGTSLPDGEWYATSVANWMYDNTSTAANTVTFDFVIETREGEVSSGTISLPVN
ncbi:hypothetical protein P886_0100 [Alteromonadaceae bacterium 2753L.S.0a.02]|nr:hypothetical protein P886_0100 [Alteromonadaceae bacterium 2753L.S.0a.02]